MQVLVFPSRMLFLLPLRWLALGSAVALLVGILVVRWVLGTRRPRSFPPGPPITPGLGNILQMPLVKPYLRFHEWSRQYGEMVGLKLATANMVVLSSARVVHELIDKRGHMYSDRPPMWIVDNHILYQPEERGRLVLDYTEPYRRWRKSFQHVLSGASIKKLLPLLEGEASTLCYRLVQGGQDGAGGDDFVRLLRRWAVPVPLLMTCGQRLRDMPDTWLDDFFHGQESFIKMILPGNTPPVDLLPPLRYVPEFLASWKASAREARRLFLRDAYGLLEMGKANLRRTADDPRRTFAGMDSLIGKAVRDREEGVRVTNGDRPEYVTDQYVAFQNTGFMGAATDTSIATLSTLMLIFASYPDILARARAEVDRIAGDRPPTAEQLGDFVYLKACMLETLRWRPTTPGALPHVLAHDDHFEGYFLPKGTTFIIDAWSIGHDPDLYDRPNDFNPERFLVNPLGLRPGVADAVAKGGGTDNMSGWRPLYAFGAGRRQCPGEPLATQFIPLTVAKLLWAFDFSAPPEGIDLSIETGFVDGIVTRPVRTALTFTPRSEERRVKVLKDYGRTEAISRELLG